MNETTTASHSVSAPVVDDTSADITTTTAVAAESSRSETDTKLLVDQCLQALLDHNTKGNGSNSIKLVVFDMDQTAVQAHSRGCLRRGDSLEAYSKKAAPDWLALVPALFQAGYKLAIATHSDAAQYSEIVQPATHILGTELAHAVLDASFARKIAESFFIVAYNPRHDSVAGHLAENLVKRRHMRLLLDEVETADDILFFDDVLAVVEDCRDTCGVHAVHVDENHGFRMSDLLNYFDDN